MDSQTDERDFAATDSPLLEHDECPPDFSKEELDPDTNELFPDEFNDHIDGERETDEQGNVHSESVTHAPPQPARFYGQEGNRPVVRSGSGKSDASEASSNGQRTVGSDGSPKELDQIDAGSLFIGSQPHVANEATDTFAGRRGKRPPRRLNFGSCDNEDEALVMPVRKGSDVEKISSATFITFLRTHVGDIELQDRLLREFSELNAAKNRIAFETWKLYKQRDHDFNELMKEYYAGPGEERRRLRDEADLRAKERKRENKVRRIKNAIDEEKRQAREAAKDIRVGKGNWQVDIKGHLISPESEDEDDGGSVVGESSGDEEDDGDDEEGSPQGRQFFSDEEDPRDRKDDQAETDNGSASDEELPSDNETRHPDKQFVAEMVQSGELTGNSLRSVEHSPRPGIPIKETAQTIVSIQVLLRLLRIKVELNSQTSREDSSPNPQEIHAICERANSVCLYAEENNAPTELQGRCAFYAGMAEYMRSKVDPDNDQIHALVLMYFENAQRLCGDVYEEGAWAEEWARWMRREKVVYDSERGEGSESGAGSDMGEVVERQGTDDGLMTGVLEGLWGAAKKGVQATFGRTARPVLADKVGVPGKDSAAVETGQRSRSRLSWFGARAADSEREKTVEHLEDVTSESSSGDSSSNGGYISHQPEELLRPEGSSEIEDDEEEQLPNNVFGGLVSAADLPQPPPKKQKSVGLGLTFDGQPLEVTNTILSPSHGMLASPERLEPDAESSPTRTSKDKINRAIDDSVSPNRQYHVMNPDTPSTNPTTSTNEGDGLPAPVTTSPAISPGGSNHGFMSSIARRFSTAISPTAPNLLNPEPKSAPPAMAPATEDKDDDADFSTPERSKSLSLAERRRSSAIAGLSSVLRVGAPSAREMDSLKEAEEGNSPLKQTTFERDDVWVGSGSGSGKAKKSPLSSPNSGGVEGGESGLRSVGRGDEDMV